MQLSLLPVSTLLFSLAAAQTTTRASTSTTCAAQPVLDACMATTRGIINSCTSTDYQCLCTAYTALLTCYDQCPNDAGVTGVSNTRASYCAYVTTTSSAISRPVSSWVSSTTGASAATATTGTSEAAETTGTRTGTATSSGSTSTATGNAGVKGALINAGGLLAGVAGLAAVLL